MSLHFSSALRAAPHCRFPVLGQFHASVRAVKQITELSRDSPYLVGMDTGVKETWDQALFQFPSCATLGELLTCSEPQFPHL